MVFARQCLVGFGFNSEYKDEGTYTAICFQEDGLIDEASVDIAFPKYPPWGCECFSWHFHYWGVFV
jgi:hypothetical protein